MQKSKNNVLKVLLACGVLAVAAIGSFIYMLAYELREDISSQQPYVSFLNRPHQIKDTATIRWSGTNLRFSNYSLVTNEYSNFDSEDVKSVKHYFPGDRITFHSAKSFYSMHVDETYYLIGSDTLKSGKIIDFEYYFSEDSSNHLLLMDD